MDLNKDIINKPFVQKWYNSNKGVVPIKDMISILSCATMCPCIAIAYWLGEASNWHPDAISSIETLIKFYGYKEIKGKPENSPL